MTENKHTGNAQKHGVKRSFSEFTVKEIIALAISIERSNIRRLKAFESVFKGYDDNVARGLALLAKEEEKHEAILLSEFKKRFDEPLPPVDEKDIGGIIESFDIDDAEHLIFDSLKARHVLELAYNTEIAARQFYEDVAEETKNQELESVYSKLALMENDHATWIKQRLDEM